MKQPDFKIKVCSVHSYALGFSEGWIAIDGFRRGGWDFGEK
jgi:hypothetical protein